MAKKTQGFSPKKSLKKQYFPPSSGEFAADLGGGGAKKSRGRLQFPPQKRYNAPYDEKRAARKLAATRT